MHEHTLLCERRHNPRLDLEVQVLINLSHNSGRSKSLGWIQNISHGGFKIRSSNSINLKSLIREGDVICFETFEDFFQLKGEGGIIWISSDGNIAGVKFDELGRKGKRFLNEFLSIFHHSTPSSSLPQTVLNHPPP